MSQDAPPNRGRYAALTGLLLVVVSIFSGALFDGRVFFQRDIGTYWYARTEALVRALAEGAWPLWDPYPSFGIPCLADSSFQVFYPLTWLNLVLSAPTYFKVYVVVHCMLAGFGLFLLGRRWGLTPPAAFVAGAVWVASGPLLSMPNVLHHFAGITWLPWVLLALDVALDKGTASSALVLGAVAALQVLAGSGDMCLMTGVSALAYAASRLILPRAGPRLPGLRSAARTGLVAVGFALLLSAVQWMPTVALVTSSGRARPEPAANLLWSVHPLALADALVPGLVGEMPIGDPVREVLFEGREPFLFSLYLGMAAFALVLVALAARDAPRPRVLALAAFVFFSLCAMGAHTPLAALLRLPPFVLLRFPSKYLPVATFYWAVLAGVGVAIWSRPWSEHARPRLRFVAVPLGLVALACLGSALWVRLLPEAFRVLLLPGVDPLPAAAAAAAKLAIAAGLAALGGALIWLRARRSEAPPRLSAAMILLVVGDLVAQGRRVNNLAPPELLTQRPPVLAQMGPDVADHRIFVMSKGLIPLNRELARGPKGWEPEWGFALGLQEMLLPPSAGRWRLYGSFDGDFTGLGPAQLTAAIQILERRKRELVALRMLQMGNVAYVVSVADDSVPGLEPVAELPSVFVTPIRLLRVPEPLPWAYVVNGVRIAREPESYGIFGDSSFDPWRQVLIPGGSASRPARESFRGTARIAWRRSDALAVDVDANAAGYLVLVEAYDPGWKATVDGVPAEVLRANVLFRAVPVGEGRHHVVMRYRPKFVVLGAVLSVAGILLGLGAWGIQDLRRARGSPPRSPAVPQPQPAP